MATQKDFTSSYKPTWCPGCGNLSINPATKQALADLGLEPHQVVMTFGIGCSSNGANFYSLYSFHGIHGRSLPVAVGIKSANHELTVMADAGDGDAYGEGLNHFIHTARSNVDVTFLVHDNRMYSLTKGQMSPTCEKGIITTSTPFGAPDQRFNPLSTALVSKATFVAQGFSGDIPHLTGLIKKAIQHRGFAFINILQVCKTFNKVNTFEWYREKVYKLEEAGHDIQNYSRALEVALRDDGKLPIGVLYQAERETFGDQQPQLEHGPLVKQSIDDIDISESLKMYM